ncbi:MAG: hypothetical protein HY678_11600 [Chloroflexi bacterium]|nr:hypothetical protein [Chloroflexota bacterium]
MATLLPGANGPPGPVRALLAGWRVRALWPVLALVLLGAACYLPERPQVPPVTIKTNVLRCDEHEAAGTMTNEFGEDVSGNLTVVWVDFFGAAYHEETSGPHLINADQTVAWLIEVRDPIDPPGHCRVQLDFRN